MRISSSANCRTCGAPLTRRTQRLAAIKAVAAGIGDELLIELMPRCSMCLRYELRRRASDEEAA